MVAAKEEPRLCMQGMAVAARQMYAEVEVRSPTVCSSPRVVAAAAEERARATAAMVEGRTDSLVAVALGRALAPAAAAAATVPPAGCPEHTGPLEDQTAAWDSWQAEVLAVEA
jgi:hypothetical protein